MSNLVMTGRPPKASRLVSAISMAVEQSGPLPQDAQYGFEAVVQTPEAVIRNSDFDMEFEIPFDDDMEANEAEITVYNLSDGTRNKFRQGNSITVTAGYRGDSGIIFSGIISAVRTVKEGADRITTINALDGAAYSDAMLQETTFSTGVTASAILKSLIDRLGLPVAEFKIQRDHTYYKEVKVDGNLAENIRQYSEVCGVSTYVCRQQIYCKPIWLGYNLHFNVGEDTGLIGSPEPYEEQSTSEEYTDAVTGYDVTMILQHRISTAGIVHVESANYSGDYRIVSGKHVYDGLSATTEFRCMDTLSTSVDESKIESPPDDTAGGAAGTGQGVIAKAVSWAVGIASDDSHRYSQSVRWGPHYDCSSFVISAYRQAGVDVKSAGATYTGNMYSAFLSCGFSDVTASVNRGTGAGLKKGDVLLNTVHHTALVRQDGGKLVHASSPEKGILTADYYNYPWDYVLRYGG